MIHLTERIRQRSHLDHAALLLREDGPAAFRGVLLALHRGVGADRLERRRSLRQKLEMPLCLVIGRDDAEVFSRTRPRPGASTCPSDRASCFLFSAAFALNFWLPKVCRAVK